MTPEKIASLANEAVLRELSATPKPGLVDRNNSGAHSDMDYQTFLLSSAAIAPFFFELASFGFSSAGADPPSVFASARPIGLEAEKAMFSATRGVNTHKGMIFSMGLAVLSSGMLSGEGTVLSPSAVCFRVGELTGGLCEKDYSSPPRSVGEKIHASYGIAGARGMAESGFSPVLTFFLPFLESRLEGGETGETALVRTLLFILSQIDDTNVIKRRGVEFSLAVKAAAKEKIFSPLPEIESLDRLFIRENVSPGGSADLLALTWFLHRLKPENEPTERK